MTSFPSTMPPPGYAAMPPPGYATRPWPNQPMSRPPAADPAPPPWQGSAQVPQAPRQPVFRGKPEDDPCPPRRPAMAVEAPPAPLSLPSPEKLGVARDRAEIRPVVDWDDVQRRLEQLGAASFQQQKLLDGGYLVTCVLPGKPGNLNHRVEAEGATLGQAIALTLTRAEKWAKEN